MNGECPDCGYDEGENADDCPIHTGMSRERYALIRWCSDHPAEAADLIVELRSKITEAVTEALRDFSGMR